MLKDKPIIAVDAMGGDFGPSVVVPGAVDAARYTDTEVILVGDEDQIRAELRKMAADAPKVRIVHCTQVAGMKDKPSDVLRRKKDSSIHVACQLVRDGEADGLISAGNSGATVACGMFILGRIPGVERPALASIIRVHGLPTVLVDVGANVDCRPFHLFQFGLMADVMTKDILQIKKPRIGILSIGEEEGKGNIQVKEAFELFKLSNVNFIGNIEGRDIYTDIVDIVVCDGFVGNVALKLSEGLAQSLVRAFKSILQEGFLAKAATLLIRKSLKNFVKDLDYAEYGGAPLLGLQGAVLVCHGASSKRAIGNAVRTTATSVRMDTNKHLVDELTANEELTRFARASGRE